MDLFTNIPMVKCVKLCGKITYLLKNIPKVK